MKNNVYIIDRTQELPSDFFNRIYPDAIIDSDNQLIVIDEIEYSWNSLNPIGFNTDLKFYILKKE